MRLILGFTLLFLTTVSIAQTNYYRADLSALRSILQQTKSYKAQIKGNRLTAYDALYQQLLADSVHRPGSYGYFYNLSRLLFPLRDNHLGFYQFPNFSRFQSQASIDSFVVSNEFAAYPTCAIDVDSLTTTLATKPADSIEGVYHFGNDYSVGLFKSGANEYTGVVVDSDTKLWRKGQLAMRLYAFGPNLYKAIYGHPRFKVFMLRTVEKYANQSLVNSSFFGLDPNTVYTKNRPSTDHVNLPGGTPTFVLKTLNDTCQYLRLQTFQADPKTADKSRAFYDSVRTRLTASNLIVDLRNNAGGAKKEASRYVNLLKRYAKRNRLYLLLNNGTISQAELFTLAFKGRRNVTTAGQQTKGMLNYGSNYGRSHRLPSGSFVIYPTDMQSSAALLPYEDVGLTPDRLLSPDTDWIDQVLALMSTGQTAAN